jgi:hypothetical protein
MVGRFRRAGARRSLWGLLAVAVLLLRRCANDASADADLIINHNIEACAVFVGPYGTDAPPDAGLVASFFGILHDVGDVSWVGLEKHAVLPRDWG